MSEYDYSRCWGVDESASACDYYDRKLPADDGGYGAIGESLCVE